MKLGLIPISMNPLHIHNLAKMGRIAGATTLFAANSLNGMILIIPTVQFGLPIIVVAVARIGGNLRAK